MLTYAKNFIALKLGQRTLDPRLAIYYVTEKCNLNCTYCEDFGARRNHEFGDPSLADAKKILSIIRDGVPNLWITGGEPFLSPHLADLLTYARQDLKFRSLSLISNGTLLARNLSLLPLLDRLIISLDALQPHALNAVSVPESQTEDLLDTIRNVAKRQKTDQFKLILNAVITPETLPDFDALIHFCTENRILLSISPQAVNNWTRYELLVSPDYKAFTEKLLRLKKEGAPILGSTPYLKMLFEQTPYLCYPTIIPRIKPDGWLIYPCLPMEKEGGEVGGRPVNLQEVSSWQEAWDAAIARYGEAPTSCTSCFQQCYAEPSLMQAHPLAWLVEAVRSGIDLGTYAPG